MSNKLRKAPAGDYERLRAAFEGEMDPKNIFDTIRVQDLTDKVWEERRLKRSQAALIESALVHSLAVLFAPFHGENLEAALETAQNYYSGVPEKVRRAEKLIVQLGIASEQIEANAMYVRSLGLQTLDRMITTRKTLRNNIIKEHERRNRKPKRQRGGRQSMTMRLHVTPPGGLRDRRRKCHGFRKADCC